MDEIAEHAGVTKPVLYQHFRSKRSLYLELLSDVGGRLQQTIEKAAAAAAGPRQEVEAGFAAYFAFVAEHRSAFRLLFGSGPRRDEEFAETVRRVEHAIANTIASRIEADIDDDHRLLLGHSIVGLAEAAGRYWIGGELDLDADLLARRIADVAWAGLRSVHP